MPNFDAVLNAIWPAIAIVLLLVGLGGGRLLGLAVAVGTWASYYVLKDTLPSFPPAEGTQGLVLAIGLGGVAACLPERVPRLWRAVAAAAVFAVGSWLLLRRMLPSEIGFAWFGWLALTVLGWLLVWWGFGTFASRRGGMLVAAVMSGCLAADAFVMNALGGSLLAQLAGAAAAAMGTAAVFAIVRPFRVDLQACVPLVFAHAGWLLAGHLFSDEQNLVATLLALVAPMGLLAGGSGAQGETRRSIGTACLCAGVPAAVAVALTLPAFLETLRSPSGR